MRDAVARHSVCKNECNSALLQVCAPVPEGRFLFLPETMRLTPAVLALAVCASACSHAVRQSTPLDRSDQTYEFNEHVDGSDRSLRGTVRVTGDTAIVDVETDPCVYDVRASHGRNSQTYRCGDVTYTVDRHNPDLRVVYTFYNIVAGQKAVCTQYGTNPQGQQVCTRTAMEKVEHKVPFTGELHMRPADE